MLHINNIRNYIIKNEIDKLFNKKVSNEVTKKVQPLYLSVDKNNKSPFDIEFDDLAYLHKLIISRKVITILEFGVGYSTKLFDYAINQNINILGNNLNKKLRLDNFFEVHSIDNNKKWINHAKNSFKFSRRTKLYYSKCYLKNNGFQIFSSFKKLPNINPDLIYLDGPDQFNTLGEVNGLNTSKISRFPMSGDILYYENFLEPGTLIVVDGRSANARFLKNNLKRNWIYFYNKKIDQHYFELSEEPLGVYSKAKIDFCLGNDFYKRLKKGSFFI